MVWKGRMAIGGFMYFARQYEGIIATRKEDVESITDKFSDYQYLSDGHLMVKLFNRKSSSEYLKGKAYIPYLDLAIVFCYVYSIDNNIVKSIAIPKSASECWGITLEEALSDVLETMGKRFKVMHRSLHDIVDNLMDNSQVLLVMNMPKTKASQELETTVLTNTYIGVHDF